MKKVIYIYIESYYDAKLLFNTLYRPCVDKETSCTEELWETGKCLEVERDAEVWRIFKR